MTDQGILVYVATSLTLGKPSREPSEQDMTSRHVVAEELGNLIRGGELADAASLAAYSLYQASASGAQGRGRRARRCPARTRGQATREPGRTRRPPANKVGTGRTSTCLPGGKLRMRQFVTAD